MVESGSKLQHWWKEEAMFYPRRGRSGGGASEEPSPMCLLLSICLERGEEARVFGSLRKKKAKRALADERAAVLMGQFIA